MGFTACPSTRVLRLLGVVGMDYQKVGFNKAALNSDWHCNKYAYDAYA